MRDTLHLTTFRTVHFELRAYATHDPYYQYDGDDADGEVQAKLDNGDYVAFDTTVEVLHRDTGDVIGRSDLGGSVYACDDVASFFTGHRDPDPMNRCCTLNPRNIGHYLPDMVREAIREARDNVAKFQRLQLRHVA